MTYYSSTVYLKLSILDSKGGKTSVCDIAIKVEPNYQVRGHHDEDGQESLESYLWVFLDLCHFISFKNVISWKIKFLKLKESFLL